MLVNWPLEKVVAETPETMKAAEITRAMISLRMSRSSIRSLRLFWILCHVWGASPVELLLTNTTHDIRQG